MLTLGPGGQLSISTGLGSAHVILDVMGYVNGAITPGVRPQA